MAGENRAGQGRREAAYPKVRGRLRTQACDGLQPGWHSTQLADGAAHATALPRLFARGSAGDALSLGFVTAFLSVVICLPMAALVWASTGGEFWTAVSSAEAVAALKLTLALAAGAALVNAALGTITAWVLVRDEFRGKALVNAILDLPFALPTIVAGLVLLGLY